mgnify:CR=1 FL=1
MSDLPKNKSEWVTDLDITFMYPTRMESHPTLDSDLPPFPSHLKHFYDETLTNGCPIVGSGIIRNTEGFMHYPGIILVNHEREMSPSFHSSLVDLITRSAENSRFDAHPPLSKKSNILTQALLMDATSSYTGDEFRRALGLDELSGSLRKSELVEQLIPRPTPSHFRNPPVKLAMGVMMATYTASPDPLLNTFLTPKERLEQIKSFLVANRNESLTHAERSLKNEYNDPKQSPRKIR